MKPIAMVCLVLLLGAGAADAGEYQRYVDENGVVRFTDSLTEISEERRRSLTTHKSLDSPPPASQTPTAAATKSPSSSAAEPAPPPPSAELPADASIADIRAALDKEHSRLLADKASLDQELVDGFTTPEESRAYHQKVTALNQRIAAFEQKRTALNKRINEQNAKKAEARKSER